MLTSEQKKILEDKIYEIAKKRINEWENNKTHDGGKSKVKNKDLGKVSKTKENTILHWLDDETVNNAAIAYKVAGVENGSEEEKAAVRSLHYKKKNHEKNDNGSEYKFTNAELNKIASVLNKD